MERVTGIGGIFFEAKNPQALGVWYEEHLGINLGWDTGALFKWEDRGGTIQGPFGHDSRRAAPGDAPRVLNFRVVNLQRMLEQLHEGGVEIDPNTEESGFGKLGWCRDPEGNRVELWEPPGAH